jgi:hypothetical protein
METINLKFFFSKSGSFKFHTFELCWLKNDFCDQFYLR